MASKQLQLQMKLVWRLNFTQILLLIFYYRDFEYMQIYLTVELRRHLERCWLIDHFMPFSFELTIVC